MGRVLEVKVSALSKKKKKKKGGGVQDQSRTILKQKSICGQVCFGFENYRNRVYRRHFASSPVSSINIIVGSRALCTEPRKRTASEPMPNTWPSSSLVIHVTETVITW